MFDFSKLPELVGEGFVTSRKHPEEELYILNYTPKTQYDRHWTNETLQCRGLIVNKNNEIVARPFQKFFNFEEMTTIPNEPFEVFDKLDGSLGIMYFVKDKAFIATRGSFESPQAVKANEILEQKYKTRLFGGNPIYSYLFEIIYPENRIVCDYKGVEDTFLLTIIRTDSGKEEPFENIQKACDSKHLPFPLVKRYDGITDFEQLKQYENSTDEGFVVRFSSGLRAKMKFSEYKRLHKLLTQTSSISIWETLRDGKSMDELLERVPDEFYGWVKKTKSSLVEEFLNIEMLAIRDFAQVELTNPPTRKDWALAFKEKKSPLPVLFNMLDKKPYNEIIWKMLRPTYQKPFTQQSEEDV